ncbi:hypothetical protein VNO77_02831 [Canavalia gladiata]|uniref:Uncharacterized protein n=1 Tax=Canavalia gladiata TaxID=3824 RepID=A0AAN9R6F6_CANGL
MCFWWFFLEGRRELLKVLALHALGIPINALGIPINALGIPIRIGAVKTQHSGVSKGEQTEIDAGTYRYEMQTDEYPTSASESDRRCWWRRKRDPSTA